MPSPLSSLADSLLRWYWSDGIRRTGADTVPPSWIDRAYSVSQQVHLAQASQSLTKPRLGVWGPSQTGKTTLISMAVDGGAKPDGTGSALSFDGGPPTLFVSNAAVASSTVVFNPFNGKADASGCVARFVMAPDKLSDPRYPAELNLASELDLLAALAAGYDYECVENGTDSWHVDRLVEIMEKEFPPPASAAPMPREVFERLRLFADALELMASLSPRFADFRKNYQWRSRLLGSAGIRSCQDVEKLEGIVLWNKSANISRKWSELKSAMADRRAAWAGKKVCISLEFAAILVDINSYTLIGETTEAGRTRKEAVFAQSWEITSEGVCIGRGFTHPLFRQPSDFGVFQALVGELVIPLRRDAMVAHAPDFVAFLDQNDLVDYPGLPNQGKAAASAVFNVDAAAPNAPELLTRLFKRGKTLAIVAGAAKRMEVDGFLILCRSETFVQNASVLERLIQSWWHTANPDWNDQTATPLPLRGAVTFFGSIVSNLVTNPKMDVTGTFKMLNDLGGNFKNDRCAFYATTYKHLPANAGGRIDGTPEQCAAALEKIRNTPVFREYFSSRESLASLDRMREDPDGGVGHLFKNTRLGLEVRRSLAVAAGRRNRREIEALLAEALPSQDQSMQKRIQVLDRVHKAIDAWCNGDPTNKWANREIASCSLVIRTLLHVPHDVLDPVPGQIKADPKAVFDYVERQLVRWQGTKAEPGANVRRIGMEDATDAQFLARILSEGLVDPLGEWLQDNFPALKSQSDAVECKRFLALAIENWLLYGALHPQRQVARPKFAGENMDEIIDEITKLAVKAKKVRTYTVDHSPHWATVIQPFKARLDALKAAASPRRQPQPGDEHLMALKQQLDSLPA